MFHPRIVPLPNATITELGITELFYYGLLLPNVAHSTIRNNLLWTRPIRTRLKFTGGNKPSILSNAG